MNIVSVPVSRASRVDERSARASHRVIEPPLELLVARALHHRLAADRLPGERGVVAAQSGLLKHDADRLALLQRAEPES